MTSIHGAGGSQSYEMASLHAGAGAAGSSTSDGFNAAVQSHATPGSPQGSVASFQTADEGAGQGTTEKPEPKGKGKATESPQTSAGPSVAPIQTQNLGSPGLLRPPAAQGGAQPGTAGPSNWQSQSQAGAVSTPVSDAPSSAHRRATQTAISNPDATIMSGVNRISPDQRGTTNSSLATLNNQEGIMNGIIAQGQPRPDPSGRVAEEGGQPSLMAQQHALQGQSINNEIHAAKNDAAAGAQHAMGLMSQNKTDEAETHMQNTLTDLNSTTSRITGSGANLIEGSQNLASNEARNTISAETRNISNRALYVAGATGLSSLGVSVGTLATTLARNGGG